MKAVHCLRSNYLNFCRIDCFVNLFLFTLHIVCERNTVLFYLSFNSFLLFSISRIFLTLSSNIGASGSPSLLSLFIFTSEFSTSFSKHFNSPSTAFRVFCSLNDKVWIIKYKFLCISRTKLKMFVWISQSMRHLYYTRIKINKVE